MFFGTDGSRDRNNILNSPDFNFSPSLSTAKAAVEPVPKPTTIPDTTKSSTALYPTNFFNSYWLNYVPVDIILILLARETEEDNGANKPGLCGRKAWVTANVEAKKASLINGRVM